MTTDVKMAKKAIHDKIEAEIKTAEAKLYTLKAKAESAKANLEIKAIAELLARKQEILQKLHELRKSDGSQGKQFKTDVAVWIADVEKSVKRTESKPKAT